MPCASGRRCPLGGDHALYGGLSVCPEQRDRQHRRKPWYRYRSGSMTVLPGVYGSFESAKAAESTLLASGRYLANEAENEWNPCRWDFGPVRAADRPVWRRRWFWVAVLAVVWLVATVGLWWYAGHRGWSGLGWSAVTITASSVWIYRKSQRRKARRRRRRGW
jgi:hypothetical protein